MSLHHAQLFRNAANTQRYHTKRMLSTQTVGAHTFNMLLLLRQVEPLARPELIWACAHHDLPEYFTGDIPAPMKMASPELKVLLEGLESDLAPLYYSPDLTVEEEALLKWVDLMELVLHCLEEIRMGNRMDAPEMAKTGLEWLNNMPVYNAVAGRLLDAVRVLAHTNFVI